MQAILERPAQLSYYLFSSAPDWIRSTHAKYSGTPWLAVGAASAVGASAYSLCAAVTFLLQAPCTAAQAYLEKRDDRKSE